MVYYLCTLYSTKKGDLVRNLVLPKFKEIPERLRNFVLADHELEFDDPYIRSYPADMDYKTIGEQKENDVLNRCHENGWLAYVRRFGESNEIDSVLVKNNDDIVHINVQIRGLAYHPDDDLFTAETTCTRNGNPRAQLSDASFILVWTPFVIKTPLCRRRGVYIIPKEEYVKYSRRMRFYPHREPSNISKGNLKNEDTNQFFEAWYLLDDFWENAMEHIDVFVSR